MPANIFWTAAASGSAFVSEPTAGVFDVDEPPERLIARTIATATATIAAPAAMSTFGEARRAGGRAFDDDGGTLTGA